MNAPLGVTFSREQIEAWVGFALTDEQIAELEEAAPNSSIPDAFGAIATEGLGYTEVATRGCSCGMADHGAPGHDGDPASTRVVISDAFSNHNLPIGAHVQPTDPPAEYGETDTAGDWYTQGIVGDEVSIDPRDLASLCAEGGHVNDDNPGRPICRTCEDDPNVAALYEERDPTPVERWEVTTPPDVYLTDD